ncbi:histidine phosphatase family protein [Ruegeria pomeroyi]|nr:histidine phosphatase family protein [Ruegeria pomeroyi]MCE8531516.1 histidine phosphatase family protein [Ruegeria pomeroyi]
MTRILILTRHAKSAWDDISLGDHDRTLNKRGRRSAQAIGAWLRQHGYLPDQVISSDAVRTRETWTEMGLGGCEPEFTRALYLAPPEQLLSSLRQASGRVVLLLGHNPGIAEFAGQIVDEAPAHARFFDYPTGATTVIEFATDDWAQIGWHQGEVLDFIVPRELTE